MQMLSAGLCSRCSISSLEQFLPSLEQFLPTTEKQITVAGVSGIRIKPSMPKAPKVILHYSGITPVVIPS